MAQHLTAARKITEGDQFVVQVDQRFNWVKLARLTGDTIVVNGEKMNVLAVQTNNGNYYHLTCEKWIDDTPLLQRAIGYVLFILLFGPGQIFSIPLLKIGLLMPKTGDKRTIGEAMNYVMVSLVGSIVVYFTILAALIFSNI